jgi:hypothetical protein
MPFVHYTRNGLSTFHTIEFPGDGISVFHVKEAVLSKSDRRFQKRDPVYLHQMTTKHFFDYEISSPGLARVFEDENEIIPKNAHLVIKRIPDLESLVARLWAGTPRIGIRIPIKVIHHKEHKRTNDMYGDFNMDPAPYIPPSNKEKKTYPPIHQ